MYENVIFAAETFIYTFDLDENDTTADYEESPVAGICHVVLLSLSLFSDCSEQCYYLSQSQCYSIARDRL